MQIVNTVVLDGDKVLLLYKEHRDWYVAPGGKVEEDETLTDGAIRELFEETGIIVEEVELMSVAHINNFDKSFTLNTYLATSHSGELKSVCHEGTNDWHDIHAIDDLPMNEGDRILVKNAIFSRCFLEAEISFDEDFNIIEYGVR